MYLTETDVFRLIKLLYIIITVSALIILKEALCYGSYGYSGINEGYLRPLCDKIFAINGVLTAFAIVFRERMKICTK